MPFLGQNLFLNYKKKRISQDPSDNFVKKYLCYLNRSERMASIAIKTINWPGMEKNIPIDYWKNTHSVLYRYMRCVMTRSVQKVVKLRVKSCAIGVFVSMLPPLTRKTMTLFEIRNQTEVRGPPGCVDFLALALLYTYLKSKNLNVNALKERSWAHLCYRRRIEVKSRFIVQGYNYPRILHCCAKSKNMLFIFPWLLTWNVLSELNGRRLILLTSYCVYKLAFRTTRRWFYE